ncbi:MAG: transglycosylase domain-containing protein [Acidimicrobiales bacterium]
MPFFVRVLTLVSVTTVAVPIVVLVTLLASVIFLPLPAVLPDARPPQGVQPSRMYDINGNLIGEFREFELSKPVEPEDIPEVLKEAVISIEDRRFYSHGGVDVQGTMRALWADVRAGEAVQGGSTITQQYVKNTYVGNERTLSRKIREAVLASQLDRQVDKDEVLFRYLQQIFLGDGAIGVGAAAETYFGKSVRDLSLSEAAMLAGLIPAPSRYEPRGNLQRAEERRKLVLAAMLSERHISQRQHDEAVAQTLFLVGGDAPPPPEGVPVTLIQPRPRFETPYPYFADYVQRHLAARYGDRAVFEQGLEIYTTLDPRMQAEAQRAVGATLEGTEPGLEMSLVSVEPSRGYVMALVGGRDFQVSSVNLALGSDGGGLDRQTGSTFKPFVLATALEEGVSPDRTYSGRNNRCFPGKCFENFGGSSYGTINLRAATVNSVNTVFVQLLDDVGIDDTLDLTESLAIEAPADRSQLGLAVALGATGASPLEMASAFGVFAARGERAEPTPVIKVLDSDGVVLEDNSEPSRARVLKESTADTLNDIMRGVFGGTARGKDIDRPAAGKTGTTSDSKDAWFVGYTPALSTSVWMGYRDEGRPLVGIKGRRQGVTGGSFPAETWQDYMRAAVEPIPVTDFTEPAPILEVIDAAKREARKGFNPGPEKEPSDTPGGSYSEDLPPPAVATPSATTTTAPPTTTTTKPDDEDDGGPGGLFGEPPRGPPGD